MKEKQSKSTDRRRYDASFKSNVVKMYESGRSVSSLSQSFEVKDSTIYRWISDSKANVSSGDVSLQEELKALRKALKQVTQERDVLKKALCIFSQTT